MNLKDQAIEKQPVYIVVDDVESRLLDGHTKTFRKALLKSEKLEINQIIIKGSGEAEDYGAYGIDKTLYVAEGRATLRQSGINADIRQGHLIVVPRGVPWGPGLFVNSDQLTLLDIAQVFENQSNISSSDTGRQTTICVIKPENVPSYPPAGHFKTTNRCLFLNEHVEIIEGFIEAGGGAERHLHHEHEQILYVLEGSDKPLLIYYPQGTPHGTGGGISTHLKLLVIYSPPLGEAQNALKG